MSQLSFPRPTRQGGFFLIALLGIVVGAINYGNNLGLLLSFLFIGGCAASLLHTRAFAKAVEVGFAGAEPVFAGEEARFTFSVAAPEPGHLLQAGFSGSPRQDVLPEENSPTMATIPCPAPVRGLFRPGPLQVRTCYPLGLFELRRTLETDAACVVYPRPYAEAMALPEGGLGEGEGEPAGPGVDDFAGLRAYIPGDPLQRVAWKVSSRGHGLQTKEFHALSGQNPLLDWYLLPEADTETRLSMLCRMLLTAEENGQAYGLRLPTGEIAPESGPRHLQRCLRELALFSFE